MDDFGGKNMINIVFVEIKILLGFDIYIIDIIVYIKFIVVMLLIKLIISIRFRF